VSRRALRRAHTVEGVATACHANTLSRGLYHNEMSKQIKMNYIIVKTVKLGPTVLLGSLAGEEVLKQ
jgi:hypothetical protein